MAIKSENNELFEGLLDSSNYSDFDKTNCKGNKAKKNDIHWSIIDYIIGTTTLEVPSVEETKTLASLGEVLRNNGYKDIGSSIYKNDAKNVYARIVAGKIYYTKDYTSATTDGIQSLGAETEPAVAKGGGLPEKTVILGRFDSLKPWKNGRCLWYTKKDGTKGVKSGFDSIDSIDTVAKLRTSFSDAKYLNRPPENPILPLDHGKFIADVIKRQALMAEAKQSSPQTVSNDTLDSLTYFEDNVYGLKWQYDASKGQYYTIEKGVKKYYDETTSENCYSTYLSKDEGKCKTVADCLLTGDHKNLSSCIAKLNDEDMFSVAKEDLQKVGPDRVVQILKTFGFQGKSRTDANGNKYKEVQSYDEWLNTANNNIKTSVNGNPKLSTYLRGLVAICNANPSILNKGLAIKAQTQQSVGSLGLKRHVPLTASKDPKTALNSLASALRSADINTISSSSLIAPLLSGALSGTFESPYTSVVPTIGGGFYKGSTMKGGVLASELSDVNRTASADAFAKLFESLRSTLRSMRIELDNTDVERYNNTIRQLKKYEDQLAKLMTLLVRIVAVARFYGVELNNLESVNPVTLSLSDIKTTSDVESWVKCKAKQLVGTMDSNLAVQNSVVAQILRNILPRMCDSATGCNQSAPVTTTSSSASNLVPL